MTEIKLFLFGAPRLERDGNNIELGLRKALAMIAYLAVTEQSQRRDVLAGLLWPENDQATARSNLRRTLYLIQQKVGDDLLVVSKETLSISSEVHLWLDVRVFQKHVAECLPESASDTLLRPPCRTRLEEAATLYTDDFMAGFAVPGGAEFEEWQFFEREGLRQKLADVLRQLAQHYQLNHSPGTAIPYARRWLALDHLHEPAHRMLMELYAHTNQQAAAIRQYQECCRLLDESLGVAPESNTVALYEAIRTGKVPAVAPATFQPPEIQYVRSGDAHIAYQVLGAGPADLMIIPGFVSHLEEIWESPSLAQSLRHLAGMSRLILFDKRGVGLSERVGYPPTLEHTMDDMLSVLDAVGSERVFLFGFSEGGPSSLVFCAAHPERVLGLILYGTLAKGMRSSDYPWALTDKQYAEWSDWLVSVWGKPVPHLYFAPSRESDHDLWEWYARLLRLGSSPGGIRAVLEVLQQIDVRQVLPTIRTPTLVMHRQGDQAMRVAAGRYLAENIPEAHYVELPGDDHWWWLGDTEPIMKEIQAFLSGLRPAPMTDQLLATIVCIVLAQNKPSNESQLQLQSAINREVNKQRGRQMKSTGRIYLSTFDGPSRAIRCAVALNRIALQHGFGLRIALHSGECDVVDGRLQGEAVEIAKAAVQMADEQHVLVSRTVKDLVVGAGFLFESRGDASLGEGLGTWEFFQVKQGTGTA